MHILQIKLTKLAVCNLNIKQVHTEPLQIMKTINKTTLFLILVFLISFSVAGIYKILCGRNAGTFHFNLLAIAYMFIPTICVLIVEKLIHKEKIKTRSEEHTSELQSRPHLVCRLLLEKKKKKI